MGQNGFTQTATRIQPFAKPLSLPRSGWMLFLIPGSTNMTDSERAAGGRHRLHTSRCWQGCRSRDCLSTHLWRARAFPRRPGQASQGLPLPTVCLQLCRGSGQADQGQDSLGLRQPGPALSKGFLNLSRGRTDPSPIHPQDTSPVSGGAFPGHCRCRDLLPPFYSGAPQYSAAMHVDPHPLFETASPKTRVYPFCTYNEYAGLTPRVCEDTHRGL